ncbi:kleisin alpha [Nakaseomyces bracarensis]|uniref:kleisin alpha n=1 Tax=Nakaseomyces bracarensis TaxID=273131 RepID=UPI00387223A6
MTDQRPTFSTVLKLTTKTGPLAQIWLASNMSNLTRNSVLQTSIVDSADEIAKVTGVSEDNGEYPVEHITLRTSGELLHGIVRVYSKKATFLLTDIKDTLTRITSLFRTNQRLGTTISKLSTIARVELLVLQDTVTERDVLSVPSLDFLTETDGARSAALINDSMDRRMTGAKSWDMPIEVGRRFGGDESELHEEQDSTLNLDFDLDGKDINRGPLSSSKSWDEGTRQSSEFSTTQSNNLNIEDDEFLAEGENQELELDLGFNDDNGTDQSIEVGRRADIDDMMSERPTDFGFDLDIGKELNEENEEEEEEVAEEELNIQEQDTASRRRTKNPTLTNAHPLETDTTTELSDEYVKSNSGRNLSSNVELTSSRAVDKLTTKRIWSEMAQSLSYLPTPIVENIMKFQPSKRQRLSYQDESSEFEPEMDISLGLNDDIVSDNDNNESEPPHMDIGEIYIVDEAHGEATNEDGAAEGTLDIFPTQDSEFDTSMEENRKQEIASKFTTGVARVLRESINKDTDDTTSFSSLLENFHLQDEENKNEPITKKDACSVFFSMLTLASTDCVELEQEETFGTINVTSKPNLYQEYITA